MSFENFIEFPSIADLNGNQRDVKAVVLCCVADVYGIFPKSTTSHWGFCRNLKGKLKKKFDVSMTSESRLFRF